MKMYPYLTNVRSLIVDRFYAQQTYARRDFLFAKLMGKSTKLALFPEQTPRESPNRRFIGMKDIPIEQIVGTLNRQSDYDHKFRPLKSYLRDRWVNAYLTLENTGWAPILVHKVADRYYVEDGHHRVSVARSLEMTFIQAKIWEYPVQRRQPRNYPTPQWIEKSSVPAQCQDK